LLAALARRFGRDRATGLGAAGVAAALVGLLLASSTGGHALSFKGHYAIGLIAAYLLVDVPPTWWAAALPPVAYLWLVATERALTLSLPSVTGGTRVGATVVMWLLGYVPLLLALLLLTRIWSRLAVR